MKKPDYKKILPIAVIALLCFFFVFGIVWGANSLLEMEGTMVPADLTDGAVACPQTKDEAASLLSSAIDKALEEKPRLSSSDSVKIGDKNEDDEPERLVISGDDSSLAQTVAQHIKDGAADAFEDSFGEISADYDEGFADKLWIPGLSAADITDFECTYIYYTCPQCGESFDEAADKCPDCGNPEPLEMRYRDEYTLTLYLADEKAPVAENSPLSRNFKLRTQEDIHSFIGNNFDGYLKCGDFGLSYRAAKITAKIDRLTNQINSLAYYKETDVNTAATFVDAFSSLGTQNVYFEVREEVKFSFSWASLKLSANNLGIDFNTTEALKAVLTCNDPVKQTVTWKSSDESVATVDSEGYVKSGKKSGKTTVTASFVFNGKTYTDECEIFVRTAAESLDISKRSLEMKVGETYTLTAVVSPKKATVKTVTWHSDNEAVATVDKNGVITAVGTGQVNIYALSDDGYYKATCKTEVK